MTTQQNFEKTSFNVRTMGAAIFVAALLVNASLAQAATDTTTPVTPTAADKTERVVSDSWITTKVKSEILANSVSKAFKVSVKTKFGVVSLGGKLPNQDAIDLVKMIAEKVNGVKSVDVSGLSIAM
jgi:hyperosmotically inducible protein